MIDGWPEDLFDTFLEATAIVAHFLYAFGARPSAGVFEFFEQGVLDPSTIAMALSWAETHRESPDRDVMGIRDATFNEILRRSAERRIPFPRTVTTLLGDGAPQWLTAESREGYGKLQPHEFSRGGWWRLRAIETQIAIERELTGVPPEGAVAVKILVALLWTAVALASFMDPAIFLGEHISYVSSVRSGGQFTIDGGHRSENLSAFQPSSMLPMVRILRAALADPLLTAADLMWIGSSIARPRRVADLFSNSGDPDEPGFDLFLSHRGRDAKRTLAAVVETLPQDHGVFLDCFTLPRGVINRRFVYASLASSRQVLIVDTDHFDESAWCRKEKWFAGALGDEGLLTVEHLPLASAAARVAQIGPASRRKRPIAAHDYPITPRILSDIEYWARTPNVHSLKEAGHTTECFAPFERALLKRTGDLDVETAGAAVVEGLTAVIAAAPDAMPFDLWASALQYSAAIFAEKAHANGKSDVRRGIDRLNEALRTFVGSRLQDDPVFRAEPVGHLALIAAAAAIEMAHFALHERLASAVRAALRGTVGLHENLLLLDVREAGAKRDFRLRLVAVLVSAGIGSVGIVQDAADEVHNGSAGDLPLEVLPCVTLHPGMRAPFHV